MSKLEALKRCEDREYLANLLGYSLKQFTAIIYGRRPEDNYKSFTIPKKTGGSRSILAPQNGLKKLQQKLAHYLSDCFEEIEINRLSKLDKSASILSFSSHGFRRKLKINDSQEEYPFSIYSNAKNHINKRYVLNIDIKDFFESITFSRIVGFFNKNYYFLLNIDIAITIAQIATYRDCDRTEGYLPQGSPLSPIISNLIGNLIDHKMLRLAKKFKLDYTRYADDITLSTNMKKFPPEIALRKQDNWVVGSHLKKTIKSTGFRINESKTRLYTRNKRQEVTSLSVNKKVNISKRYYRYTRSMVNEYCKTGEFYKSSEHSKSDIVSSNSLNGILSFIYFIKHDRSLELDSTYTKYIEMKGVQKLYTKFLFHYHFIYPQRTTVIGEGKTDSRHLRIAYKRIYSTNSLGIKFTFLGNSKRFSYFTGINDGGTPLLQKFLADYKDINKSQVTGPCPCIILLDGDKAGNSVIKTAKDNFKDTIKEIKIPNLGLMPIYHIYNNLYIFQLDKDVDIEKLYDSEILQMKIGNRTFNPSNRDIDINKFYNKTEFLEKIIEPNRNKIDFSKFKKVLKTLNYIQLYHLIFYYSKVDLNTVWEDNTKS